MTNKTISTTVEILGKPYPIRCPEEELESLKAAAHYLDTKMAEIQDSGKVINLERIAIIAALNIAYQFLELDNQKSNFIGKVNQRISSMQEKLDTAINKALQTELLYAVE